MKLARAEPVFWDVVDGATVICHEDRAAFVRLNDSARLLWEEIDGATLEDLVDRLGRRFPGVDRGVLHADVAAFVEALRTRGLITTDSPGGD
jgi:hypothetical protein